MSDYIDKLEQEYEKKNRRIAELEVLRDADGERIADLELRHYQHNKEWKVHHKRIAELEARLDQAIELSPQEVQSNHSRVKWAENLIRQLPETHDGRNSWLLNYAKPTVGEGEA